MRKPLSSSVLAITIALFAHAEAWAISNGVPDGNGHPAVGALYVDFDSNGTITGDELVCSGAYVGRTKDNGYDAFLTAGHCVEFAEEDGITQMYVSFDTLAFDPDGPTGIIPSMAFFSIRTLATIRAIGMTLASSCFRQARW